MFDPYHKWLGIAKDEQPPTYYRLLGINPSERDPEVIEEAAIRQTSHVRAYQMGPHAEQCTRLLNEIAKARATLLDAAKREAYDMRLLPRPESTPRSPPLIRVAPRRSVPASGGISRAVMAASICASVAVVGIAALLWAVLGHGLANKATGVKAPEQTTATVDQAGNEGPLVAAPKRIEPILAAHPVARWVFASDTKDTLGNLHGRMTGKPQFLDGRRRRTRLRSDRGTLL